MWLLTEMVWGGLHGTLSGVKIAKALQDPQTSDEITTFMNKHGMSESASIEENTTWLENLSPQNKAEFQNLIMKSVTIKQLAGFGSTFTVCVIVFGMIGFLGGILTKTWIYIGILPIISFLLNNPILRFGIIRDMPNNQKIIIVLIAQFLACYMFAYIGVLLNRSLSKKRQLKEGILNNTINQNAA